MIATLKLFLLLLLLVPLSVLSDNPTAIVKPYDGPDPGYILAESDGGLSNRLRVLAAYMWIAYAKFGGAHLVFVWDVNEACPGHFLQVFEPVPTVVFATNSSRYVLDKNAKIVYENSLAVFQWTMQMNNIPKNKFGMPSWNEIEYKMYSRFVPNREVMTKVNAFVTKHRICNASAMHIRVTDLAVHMARKKKGVNINAYVEFVESRPAEEPIYLLTDNPTTQRLFLEKYGRKKILVYEDIKGNEEQQAVQLTNKVNDLAGMIIHGGDSNPPSAVAGNSSPPPRRGGGVGHGKAKHHHHRGGNNSLSEDHRFTTIDHTLIDVLIAAHAKNFKPAIFSSLSDLVSMFKSIGYRDRGWCS